MLSAAKGWDAALIGGVALAFGAPGWAVLLPAALLLAYRLWRLVGSSRIG